MGTFLKARGVLRGYFPKPCASKEVFGWKIPDRSFPKGRKGIKTSLRSPSLPPLDRLRAWLDLHIRFLKKAEMRNGFLIGNFSIEVADHSPSDSTAARGNL